ncbi:bifunctional diguanylate cyclase/phosphohydrolase [Sulfurimonas sp.]
MVSFQSDNYEKTLIAMVEMIEQRDTYTAGHSKRVARYCEIIARNMGYTEEECITIHQAGILHDVGKVGTPDAVLLNPKKLNPLEYILIQEHVVMSHKLLNNIPMFEPLSEIIHSHHERYDGNGYPRGLKGDEVVPLARIMIVADAFDAMTTNRIYKSRKTVDEALEELKSLSSKQFHPEVVEKAVVALRDIEIDETINQLPKTKLEEERFAYFYNDTLSNAYNQNYLDVVLMKNNQNLKFENMEIIMISNFSKYNKEHSWKEGDKLLSNFSNALCASLDDSTVYRVFGDDFVVLSKEKLDLSETKKELDKIIKDKNISYQIKSIDLSKVSIDRVSQIENYKH